MAYALLKQLSSICKFMRGSYFEMLPKIDIYLVLKLYEKKLAKLRLI